MSQHSRALCLCANVNFDPFQFHALEDGEGQKESTVSQALVLVCYLHQFDTCITYVHSNATRGTFFGVGGEESWTVPSSTQGFYLALF